MSDAQSLFGSITMPSYVGYWLTPEDLLTDDSSEVFASASSMSIVEVLGNPYATDATVILEGFYDADEFTVTAIHHSTLCTDCEGPSSIFAEDAGATPFYGAVCTTCATAYRKLVSFDDVAGLWELKSTPIDSADLAEGRALRAAKRAENGRVHEAGLRETGLGILSQGVVFWLTEAIAGIAPGDEVKVVGVARDLVDSLRAVDVSLLEDYRPVIAEMLKPHAEEIVGMQKILTSMEIQNGTLDWVVWALSA